MKIGTIKLLIDCCCLICFSGQWKSLNLHLVTCLLLKFISSFPDWPVLIELEESFLGNDGKPERNLSSRKQREIKGKPGSRIAYQVHLIDEMKSQFSPAKVEILSVPSNRNTNVPAILRSKANYAKLTNEKKMQIWPTDWPLNTNTMCVRVGWT